MNMCMYMYMYMHSQLMETELDHSSASTAFEGYTVNWSGHRDSVKEYMQLQHSAIEAKTKVWRVCGVCVCVCVWCVMSVVVRAGE
jgi:hypothetical protein